MKKDAAVYFTTKRFLDKANLSEEAILSLNMAKFLDNDNFPHGNEFYDLLPDRLKTKIFTDGTKKMHGYTIEALSIWLDEKISEMV